MNNECDDLRINFLAEPALHILLFVVSTFFYNNKKTLQKIQITGGKKKNFGCDSTTA
jgi:hypothetical protein